MSSSLMAVVGMAQPVCYVILVSTEHAHTYSLMNTHICSQWLAGPDAWPWVSIHSRKAHGDGEILRLLADVPGSSVVRNVSL